MANPVIETGKDSARLGFHHSAIDVGACERADRAHRFPAGDDDDLNPAIDFDSL